jgi:hypothetical protein
MAADPENRDGRKRVAAEVAVEKRLDIYCHDMFGGFFVRSVVLVFLQSPFSLLLHDDWADILGSPPSLNKPIYLTFWIPLVI